MARFFQCLLIIAQATGNKWQAVIRRTVPRIGLLPQLICLCCLLQLPGYVQVVGCLYGEPFPVADLFAKLISLARIFCLPTRLAKVTVGDRHGSIGHSEVRVEFYRSLVEWQSGWRPFRIVSLFS